MWWGAEDAPRYGVPRLGGEVGARTAPSPHPVTRPLPSLPADPPAQSQRGQEQHHEDEEGVALVHGGPVLPGAEAGGRGAEVRWAHPHAAPPANAASQKGPLGRGGFPR